MTYPSENSALSERDAHIERALLDGMDKYQVPGVSLAVIHDYSIIWARAYGALQADQPETARADTLFQACSISKAVTAVAVLRLVQAGALDLDTDVNQYLKTWKIPANETWQPSVTVRQLLSHTAGTTIHWYYGYHRDQDIPSLLQILAGEKPANTPGVRVNTLPGSRYRYSGGGYCVLQQLLCDLRQQPFPELMRELVLDPVGMERSTFEQPLPEKYWEDTSSGHRAGGKPLAGGWHTLPEMAAAGLWTTASDLARFSIEIQSAIAGQTGRLLSPEMAHELLSPQVQRDASGFMGLGVWLDGTGENSRFGHPGDNEGFGSHWTAWREGGKGAVIMTNSDTGGELIAEVLSDIAQAYHWPALENLPPATPFPNAVPTNYVGTYQFQSGTTCTIDLKNDGLYLHLPPQSPVALTTVTTTIYTLQSLEGEVIFLVNDAGIVRGLLLRQDGSEQAADKIS